ncbi:transposable element Tcb1 transposase [Trichonephila clavipes]|nr:transposable element Tcb1 transposase [Trichonephila clavipes]
MFYLVELSDDWNVDVPSWKYPRNLESPRVSSPGFGNDSKLMVIKAKTDGSRIELQSIDKNEKLINPLAKRSYHTKVKTVSLKRFNAYIRETIEILGLKPKHTDLLPPSLTRYFLLVLTPRKFWIGAVALIIVFLPQTILPFPTSIKNCSLVRTALASNVSTWF